MYFDHCRFFRERPGQHELGLEYGLARCHSAVEGGSHPAQNWMPNSPLNVGNHLAGVGLIPASVKVLGHHPELDDEIAGEILGLDLAALFAPEPKQRILVIAHDDPGVRAADKVAAA